MGFTLPSWVTDNFGYIALFGAIMFGLNAIHNAGYDKRSNEVLIEQQREKEIRNEVTREVNAALKQWTEQNNARFDDLQAQLEAALPKTPKQPERPKPPTVVVKPKAPTTYSPPPTASGGIVVGKQDSVSDTSTSVIESLPTPPEITLAWDAYALALDGEL